MSAIAVKVPPSKSVTQRALVLAALGREPCTLVGPLDCDDSRALARGLTALGATITIGAEAWLLEPPAAPLAPPGPLQLENAGTAVRFLTGLAPLVRGAYVIDGNVAMRRRPMPGLLDAVRQLGVRVEELGSPGCPPVRLTAGAGEPLPPGAPAPVTLRAGGSSQELSALLLAGCATPTGLAVEVEGELPSQPYLELTLAVMAAFGVEVARPRASLYRVPPSRPRCGRYEVEGDWSSASYPLAAAWLTGQAVELRGVSPTSAQGDRAIGELLARLRAPGPRSLVMTACPDLVPTVAACALFATGATEIHGVAHLRIKESDRLAGLAEELGRLGAQVQELDDGLAILPGPLVAAPLDPRGDHRLAMAFGLVSLRLPGLSVTDRACVSKSYPGFWQELERFA